MPFLLTLVYLFRGFQSQAAHLTSLLARSSTAISTPAFICPAHQRTMWDSLWSCLATIFACSWVSVHPNIPGPMNVYGEISYVVSSSRSGQYSVRKRQSLGHFVVRRSYHRKVHSGKLSN